MHPLASINSVEQMLHKQYESELLDWLAEAVELLLEERGVASEGEP